MTQRSRQSFDERSAGDNHHGAFDPELDRRTLRKLDWILLPFLSILFLLNSLDRSNIGNAETANFTHDTGLEPEDLNVAVACFFAFFVALQPVGAAAGRKFGMARWVPGVMAIWGICTMMHILVRKRWQLITLRILIGILEAGFYPTTVSYLSLFYTRYEFARRLGLFYGQYAVAGAFGGIISYIVFSLFPKTDHPHPQAWKSWQVLFLLEGCLTVAVAIVGLLWLPRSADTAWFLSEEERSWAEKRVRIDLEHIDDIPSPPSVHAEERSSIESDHAPISRLLSETDDPEMEELTRKPSLTSDIGLSKFDVLSTLVSLPVLLLLLVLNIASALPSMAFSIFLPLILSSMNITSPIHSNLLTAPPFILAAIVLYAFTYWSDKIRKRILPIIVGLAITAFGLLATVLAPTALAKYVSLCILLSGSFIASPLSVAWLTGNTPEPGKRSTVLGINGWGNLAGVLSSLLFSPSYSSTGYRLPLLVTTCCVLIALVGFVFFRIWIQKINSSREKFLQSLDEDDKERERKWGMGVGATRTTYLTHGSWEKFVRTWIGERLWGMDERAWIRRGDERLTFRYGL